MSDIYTLSMILSIVTFSMTTFITPGPTNIILLSSVLTFGYKKSLPFMVGTILSYPLMTFLIGLGIGTFITKHALIMSSIKIGGILYLLFMAYKIAQDTSAYEKQEQTKPLNFWQSALLPWLNPKAWIVNVSAMSIFITNPNESFWQIGVIVLFTFLAAITASYTWAFGAIMLRRFMNNLRFIRGFNITMAILLVASVVPFMIE